MGTESRKMYFHGRRKNHILTCLSLQATPFRGGQCGAENENLRKIRSTYCHGTVFAPKQCEYQKDATGMDPPKMYSSSQCKHRTYLYGPANYPVFRGAV